MAHTFNKSTLFSLLVLLGMFSCSKEIKGPESVPGDEQLSKFDGIISELTAELSVDAYSYAVTTNKDVLKLVEHGLLADEEVQAGDISDMLLSTLLLQCSEEKLVSDGDYLSQYGVSGAQGKAQIKDVLSFTSDLTDQSINYDQNNFNEIYQVLQSVTGEEVPDLFHSNLGRKLDMKKSSIQKSGDKIVCTTTLYDLIKFSKAIDNQQLFQQEDTHSEMFRPVYLETGERSPTGLGCFIDISDARKIVWSAGQTEEYSAILMKSVTDSVSFVMIAKSKALNAPFHLKSGDIRQTPLYYAFSDALLSTDSTGHVIDLGSDHQMIRQTVEKELASGNRDAVYNALCAQLNIARFMKDQEKFKDLASVYREFFPKDIPLEQLFEQPEAKVDATMDYVRYKRNFSIEEDTTISIFATAEFSKTMTLQPWEYDNVEMYFDLNNEKSTNFNSGQDDRQYRFDYDYDEFTGGAPTFDNIKLVQYDVSPTQFNFEIAIPWKTLFNTDTIQPEKNRLYGFDIAIADNDGQAREGSLAWHSKLNETPWSNTSFLGNMMLTSAPGQAIDSVCYGIYSATPFQMDGLNKGEWDNAPRYAIANEFMSGITGPDDQSGWFRIKWDDDQLYFFVEVHDDVKRLIEKSGDYGWITDASQDTVWMLTEDKTQYAGGAQSNRYLQTEFPIKAGQYTLHYQTNQSHSFGRWTKERPELSFYGIVIYGGGETAESKEQGMELAANKEN